MVLLHFKRDDQEFILDTPLAASAEETVRQAVEVHKLQLRIRRLHAAGQQLAAQRAARAEQATAPDAAAVQGQTAADVAVQAEDKASQQPSDSGEDAPQLDALLHALDVAAQAAGNEHAARKSPLTLAALHEALSGVRAALDAWGPAAQPLLPLLEGWEQPGGSAGPGELEAGTTDMYFAGKRLDGSQPLRGQLGGANDRSKVVLKLAPRGAGRPPREPQLDAEGERAMLAWWHRRQEEQRRAAAAAEAAETACDSAGWADPRALKQAFMGMGELRIR